MRRTKQSKVETRSLLLLLAALSCSIAAVQSQPATIESSGAGTVESGVAYPSGVGHAGVGTTGPGKLVRARRNRNSDMDNRNMNKLDLGTPTAQETERIAKIAPGRNPRKEIAAYAAKLSNQPGPPFLQSAQLLFVSDDAVDKVLPRNLFYVLRFRQWPIAFNVPAPLHYNNIFTVDGGKELTLITDGDQLKKLFQRGACSVKDVESSRAAAAAWLRLKEELAQDGMYQFLPSETEAKAVAGNIVATGKAAANPQSGNMGELTATLTFSPAGQLVSVTETNTLKAGMRPICQSTKLLDRDPIVRRMAEQDLLIMGKAAKPYLDEQRAKVSPALQKAIDKIWARILLENR